MRGDYVIAGGGGALSQVPTHLDMLVNRSTRAHVGAIMAVFVCKYTLSFNATPDSMIGFNMTGFCTTGWCDEFFHDEQGDFEDVCTGHDVMGIMENVLFSISMACYMIVYRVPTDQVLMYFFVFLLMDYFVAKDQFNDCLFGFLQ